MLRRPLRFSDGLSESLAFATSRENGRVQPTFESLARVVAAMGANLQDLTLITPKLDLGHRRSLEVSDRQNRKPRGQIATATWL